MWFLLLRLITGPLVVLSATGAQRRFGHAVSGLIVGLPLSTLALLALVELQHGAAFTAAMAGSILAATGAQVVVIWCYASLAQRYGAARSLALTLLAFVVVASPFIFLSFSTLVVSVVALVATVVFLRRWPRVSARPSEGGRFRLGLRLAIAIVATVVIVTLSGRLGPAWSGLIGALPVMSLTMAFVTHRELGAEASAHFLGGVTKGSYAYVVSMLVLTNLLRTGAVLTAFALALVVSLVIQLFVHAIATPSSRLLLQRGWANLSELPFERVAPSNFRAVARSRREALAN